MSARIARRERNTAETSIEIDINLDGSGKTDISTGLPFFDHMLDQLGRHGGFDLTVHATGDLHIDSHHTVEDVSIVLGECFAEALGDKAGIRRFASGRYPLDEALIDIALDLSVDRLRSGRSTFLKCCHWEIRRSIPNSQSTAFHRSQQRR